MKIDIADIANSSTAHNNNDNNSGGNIGSSNVSFSISGSTTVPSVHLDDLKIKVLPSLCNDSVIYLEFVLSNQTEVNIGNVLHQYLCTAIYLRHLIAPNVLIGPSHFDRYRFAIKATTRRNKLHLWMQRGYNKVSGSAASFIQQAQPRVEFQFEYRDYGLRMVMVQPERE
ncbi:hypothetical protein EDD11_007598 [Mortierella claussenii]|nr:hypothetical protein EDD11_007598 [Mortierella claussenii]